jgi:hypothetical protein
VLVEPGRLVLTAAADDEATLERVENVLAGHLERVGAAEGIDVEWER